MSNVYQFKKPEKKPTSNQPPLLNLPFASKILLGIMWGVHLLIILTPVSEIEAIQTLGFVPARYDGGQSEIGLMLATPITHMFIHSGFMHLILNTLMLLAFGAGLEKVYSPQKFFLFFLASGLVGILFHLVIFYGSPIPVVGASGAVSGLFAAVLILLSKSGQLRSGKYGIWPFIAFWVGLSAFMALVFNDIAWAVHIGGFIGGFALLRLTYFRI